jgi:hypothetical protein
MGTTFYLQVVELQHDQTHPIIWARPFFTLSEKWTALSLQFKKLRQEAPANYLLCNNGAHSTISKYDGDRNFIRPEQLASLDYEKCTGGLVDILKTISRWSGEQYALVVGFDDEQN